MLNPPQSGLQVWPLIDVYRNSNGWMVKCDLAGVRRDDIQVVTSGPQLTITGVRHDWLVAEGQRTWSMEINYNRFQRSIELPCDLSNADIQVEYREGMLLIAITGC